MGAFSIFTTKKHRQKEQQSSVVSLYESYARRIGYIKYIMLFMLVVFIVFGFTFFSDTLSMENFRYMLKFMSIDVDSVIADGAKIEFDAQGKASALIINGDFAVVDANGVQIFDMTGERFLKDTEYFSDPICVSNGSGLIVCDRGGYQLDIYSVYTKIYSDTFSYPVLDLCASPGGNYAVLTAAKGYRSGIEVYDGNYRIIYYYYFADRYISSIGISADGGTAAACTLSNTSDGGFAGGMYVFNVSDDSDIIKFEYADEIPWKVWFRSDGMYVLMTDKAIRIYSRSGELKTEIGFGELTPKSYSFTDDYIAVSFSTAGLSNATTVRFYASDGSLIGDKSYHNDVSSMDIAGKYAYIYSVGTLYTVSIPDIETVKQEEAGLAYISALYDIGNDRVIFLYQGKAVLYGKDTYVLYDPDSGT